MSAACWHARVSPKLGSGLRAARVAVGSARFRARPTAPATATPNTPEIEQPDASRQRRARATEKWTAGFDSILPPIEVGVARREPPSDRYPGAAVGCRVRPNNRQGPAPKRFTSTAPFHPYPFRYAVVHVQFVWPWVGPSRGSRSAAWSRVWAAGGPWSSRPGDWGCAAGCETVAMDRSRPCWRAQRTRSSRWLGAGHWLQCRPGAGLGLVSVRNQADRFSPDHEQRQAYLPGWTDPAAA